MPRLELAQPAGTGHPADQLGLGVGADRAFRVLTAERMRTILPVVYQHLRRITSNYSRYSSANNHLIGEAAGVYIASGYFASLRQADQWAAQSKQILIDQIERQTHADGGNVEQAFGYHLFALEFFVLAGLAGRNRGDDFPPAYWQRVERMFDFLAAMVEGGERANWFGDSDDGYVLDLGGREQPATSWLGVGAVLFERPDLAARCGECPEPIHWLLGPSGVERYTKLNCRTAECDRQANAAALPVRLHSRAFPQSGYYLLQSGERSTVALADKTPEVPDEAPDDRISVLFDCGPLGFGPLAAHGHADALSFTLSIAGQPVFVDPGTYDYFTYPAWRRYFRSTPAHNTIAIDDQDQSQLLGPFLWGQRAQTRCLSFEPTDQGGTVVGEHDGYTRLADPVVHRRAVTLTAPSEAEAGSLLIVDELIAQQDHRAAFHLHLAPDCVVQALGDNGGATGNGEATGRRFAVTCSAGQFELQLDAALEVEVCRGSENPMEERLAIEEQLAAAGWVSRGYHRKDPATTLIGRCSFSGPITLRTKMTFTIDQVCSALDPPHCAVAEGDLSAYRLNG